MNPFVFEKELKIETKTRNLTVGRNTELVRKDKMIQKNQNHILLILFNKKKLIKKNL
jgi:hypothetical protein